MTENKNSIFCLSPYKKGDFFTESTIDICGTLSRCVSESENLLIEMAKAISKVANVDILKKD
jgi:hypothetical protein